MTIALGILASDGIVVAADTQESDGYWKTNQCKIQQCFHIGRLPQGIYKGTCMVSGAGTAGYLDAVSQKLIQTFLSQQHNDIIALNAAMQDELHRFYLDHVAPYMADPETRFSLLIGYQKNDVSQLWTTERSAMRDHQDYAAVGFGASHVLNLLGHVWGFRLLDAEATARLAAFAVYQAKQTIESCGKFTDVVYVHDNEETRLSRDQTEALEKEFRKYSEEIEPNAIRYLVGADKPESFRVVSRALKASRERLERIVPWVRAAGGRRREPFRPSDAEMLQPLPPTDEGER